MAALRVQDLEGERLYSVEEFMRLPLNPAKRYELVRGVIQEMSQAGGKHSLIADNLYGELRLFVKTNGLGRVLANAGFKLDIPDSPRDNVRSPDLAVIEASRVDLIDDGAIPFVPVLAVEVYSPNDRPGEYRDKLKDYRAAGWDIVWVIYPLTASPRRKAGTVEIYHL